MENDVKTIITDSDGDRLEIERLDSETIVHAVASGGRRKVLVRLDEGGRRALIWALGDGA
jgi:hypothetical protein